MNKIKTGIKELNINFYKENELDYKNTLCSLDLNMILNNLIIDEKHIQNVVKYLKENNIFFILEKENGDFSKYYTNNGEITILRSCEEYYKGNGIFSKWKDKGKINNEFQKFLKDNILNKINLCDFYCKFNQKCENNFN